MPVTDARLEGFISNESNLTVAAQVGCNGSPEGAIAGNVKNVFTGTPTPADFTFSSSTLPILVGTLVNPQFLHAVFNVTVKNVTTGETFEGGKAQITAERLSSELWRGSVTVFFNGHTLTFFGDFSGSLEVNRQVLCQIQL